MAKFQCSKVLNSEEGQGVVEYILLLAVVSTITFMVFKDKNFKAFIKGDSGMFATMKRGMMYSYRYGRDLQSTENYDSAMSYEYTSNQHEQYLNKQRNESHYFMGAEPYGQ